MSTQKQRMYERIAKHGNQLNEIFNTGLDPVALCKKLRILERKAEALTTEECNTGIDNHVKLCKILGQVKKVLFPQGVESKGAHLYTSVFINGDPRGYALKISDKQVREQNLLIHRDMGGYGILAPDLTND